MEDLVSYSHDPYSMKNIKYIIVLYICMYIILYILYVLYILLYIIPYTK